MNKFLIFFLVFFSLLIAKSQPINENYYFLATHEQKPNITPKNKLTTIKQLNELNQHTQIKPLASLKYDKEFIKKRICEVFKEECKNALIIAEKESGFNPFAISKTGDYGLFQLNCRWQGRRVGGDCTRYLDLDTNLKIAKQIYDEQGWSPWTAKKYLNI